MSEKPTSIESVYDRLTKHFLDIRQVREISAEFRTKLNTNDQRVLFVLSYIESLDIVPDWKLAEKSDTKSTSFREQGNATYKQRLLFEALELYNKSVAFATNGTASDCLALAYGNRSAVLYELQYYTDCIKDIERALKANYPDNKRKKLLERLNKSKSLASKSKVLKFCQDIHPSFTPNPTIRCASNQIEIAYSHDQGRFVRATEDIPIGEMIAIEKAFVAILQDDFIHTNCDFCIDHILNPIPCQFCPYAMYCNEECLSKAWQRHHRYECGLYEAIKSLELTKMGRLSLRVTITARDHFVEIFENSEDLQGNEEDPLLHGMILNENSELVYDSNYRGIHNLIQNTSHFKTNELFFKATTAGLVLCLLADKTKFLDHPVLSRDTMKTITAELLLRHLQTAPSNMHGISAMTSKNSNDDSSREQIHIGEGAYVISSLFNHSCAPNVVHHFHKSDLVIHTIERISKGEQIYFNYGMHYAVMPKRERQYKIKDQYFFDCNCVACVNKWPTVNEIVATKKSNIYDLSTIHRDVEQNGLEAARRWLSKLKKYMNEETSPRPNFEFCLMQEILKESFALEGNSYLH